MDAILAVLEKAGRYLLTIRITDLLDIAIMAYLVYKLLSLVKSTRAANILKGVAHLSGGAVALLGAGAAVGEIICSATWCPWGVLALMILFQPELRQILEQIGAKISACSGCSHRSSKFRRWSGHRPDGHGLHRNVQIPDRRADRL